MPRRRGESHYIVGRIKPSPERRPQQCGEYGVIQGDAAEQNGYLEWSHICEGALKSTKWFPYRIGPGDNGTGTRTDLLKTCDTKGEAVDYLNRRHGSTFDEEY